jgi:ABC-type Fe3+-siderophore transport system permease subunit
MNTKTQKLTFTKKNFNTFWFRMIFSILVGMSIITVLFLIQHS